MQFCWKGVKLSIRPSIRLNCMIFINSVFWISEVVVVCFLYIFCDFLILEQVLIFVWTHMIWSKVYACILRPVSSSIKNDQEKLNWWGVYTIQEFSVVAVEPFAGNITRISKKTMLRLFCAFYALWFWEGDKLWCHGICPFNIPLYFARHWKINEPLQDKTNKMTCVPSSDSDQPGHPPSLISLRCPLGP